MDGTLQDQYLVHGRPSEGFTRMGRPRARENADRT